MTMRLVGLGSLLKYNRRYNQNTKKKFGSPKHVAASVCFHLIGELGLQLQIGRNSQLQPPSLHSHGLRRLHRLPESQENKGVDRVLLHLLLTIFVFVCIASGFGALFHAHVLVSAREAAILLNLLSVLNQNQGEGL
jgi:hypothetical protein